MDVKLISKNNMGVVMTLILAILLSQSRFFNFLIDKHLGRMILLGFIILIAYTHKMLGLVAVLFIIIAFNHYETNMVRSYNYYEGFDASGGTIQDANNKSQMLQQDMSGNIGTSSTNNTSSSGTKTFKGREGFCMTDRESTMLRGKQSSTVPVFNNSREQSDDVSPSDNSAFKSVYESFLK